MLPFIALALRPESPTYPPATVDLSAVTSPGGSYSFACGDSGSDWLIDTAGHSNRKQQESQALAIATFGAVSVYQNNHYFWPTTYLMADADSGDDNSRGSPYCRIVGTAAATVDAGNVVTARAARSRVATLVWLGGVEQGTYTYTARLSDGSAAPVTLTVPAPHHGGAIVRYLAGTDNAMLTFEVRRTVANGQDGKIFAGCQYLQVPQPVPQPRGAKGYLARLGLYGAAN